MFSPYQNLSHSFHHQLFHQLSRPWLQEVLSLSHFFRKAVEAKSNMVHLPQAFSAVKPPTTKLISDPISKWGNEGLSPLTWKNQLSVHFPLARTFFPILGPLLVPGFCARATLNIHEVIETISVPFICCTWMKFKIVEWLLAREACHAGSFRESENMASHLSRCVVPLPGIFFEILW